MDYSDSLVRPAVCRLPSAAVKPTISFSLTRRVSTKVAGGPERSEDHRKVVCCCIAPRRGATVFLARFQCFEGCPGCGVGYSGNIGVEVVLLTGPGKVYLLRLEKFMSDP